MLEALICTYLRKVGFTSYVRDGTTYWDHPDLGQGRTFTDAVTWWMGREWEASHGCSEHPLTPERAPEIEYS